MTQHTLVRVISSPLIDVTMIIPTRMKEICWDQNFTCHRNREKKDLLKLCARDVKAKKVPSDGFCDCDRGLH